MKMKIKVFYLYRFIKVSIIELGLFIIGGGLWILKYKLQIYIVFHPVR